MKVNGNIVPLNKSLTLSDFLKNQKLNAGTIAVEHNGVIVSRSKFNDITLSDEDSLEIVRFVAGG